jgi:hypothetical protein
MVYVGMVYECRVRDRSVLHVSILLTIARILDSKNGALDSPSLHKGCENVASTIGHCLGFTNWSAKFEFIFRGWSKRFAPTLDGNRKRPPETMGECRIAQNRSGCGSPDWWRRRIVKCV